MAPAFGAVFGGVRAWWCAAPGPVRFALAALAAVVAFSMVLFHLAMGLSPVDAFYFIIRQTTRSFNNN